MEIKKNNFFSVGNDLNLPTEQLQSFWGQLEKITNNLNSQDVDNSIKDSSSISKPFAKYLFYLGAVIIILAMTWFLGLGWDIFGGGGIFLISFGYAIFFTLLGSYLWNKKDLKIPAGLLITVAVCMVPLAIYGLETYFNFWDEETQLKYRDYYSTINGKWVFMEMGTIIAGLIALYFFPFPFLTAPIFFSAWFLSMDMIPAIFTNDITWNQKYWITLVFGLILLTIGFLTDRAKKADYGFWSYFFGSIAFWGALNCLIWDENEFVLFCYLLVNLLMMCLAIILKRNVLMVFGAIGVFAYLAHLTHNLFKDSVLFPFALSAIGLLIIYLGILYQKNEKRIEKYVMSKLPNIIWKKLQ